MRDKGPKLGSLADWARTAAQMARGEPPRSRVPDVERFKERCKSNKVQPPSLLTLSVSTTCAEDARVALDYPDEMSIRRSPTGGNPGHFVPSLATALTGLRPSARSHRIRIPTDSGRWTRGQWCFSLRTVPRRTWIGMGGTVVPAAWANPTQTASRYPENASWWSDAGARSMRPFQSPVAGLV